MTLHIINHEYHLAKILKNDVNIITIGSTFSDPREILNSPLFEDLDLKHKLFFSFSPILKLIEKYVHSCTPIYIWGMQDRISYEICIFLENKSYSDFYLVPDNLEFFCRPHSSQIRLSAPKFRTLVKSILYRNFCSYFLHHTDYWCSRFIYPLRRQWKIDMPMAFFKNPKTTMSHDIQFSGTTFISQPYYLDHSLDTYIWAERMISVIKKLQEVHGSIQIKFHQRDAPEFRKLILRSGITETTAPTSRIVGIFSTMLFEKALQGDTVFSALSYFSDFFSDEYLTFCKKVCAQFEIDTMSLKPLDVQEEQFAALLANSYSN